MKSTSLAALVVSLLSSALGCGGGTSAMQCPNSPAPDASQADAGLAADASIDSGSVDGGASDGGAPGDASVPTALPSVTAAIYRIETQPTGGALGDTSTIAFFPTASGVQLRECATNETLTSLNFTYSINCNGGYLGPAIQSADGLHVTVSYSITGRTGSFDFVPSDQGLTLTGTYSFADQTTGSESGLVTGHQVN